MSVDYVREERIASQRAQTELLRAEFPHRLAVSYGAHRRQVMDLYFPHEAQGLSPLMIFLHGGGFQRGEPGYNAYVGRPYLERGATFVSMGYRLIPDLRPPDTCEDVELGLGWLAKHSSELKVDTERVCIAGASAGAVLAAIVALRHWPAECRLAADLIKGLVVISGGMYDFGKILEAAPQFCNPDSERWFADLAMSIQRVPAHTVIVRGEYDLPVVHPDSEALARAVRAHGGFVDEFVEPGADHYAAVHGFATPGTAVSERVAKILGLTAA